MEQLVFRKMRREETQQLFSLILERVRWMDQVGISHWNDFDYDRMYPLSYYQEKCEAGEVYVLVDEETGRVLSGAVLPEVDPFWPDQQPAYYIHNFVSAVGAKGAGSRFVEEVEKLARQHGKTFVRLDVLEGNRELADYYGSRGYEIRGRCQEGKYQGILREKKMIKEHIL